MKDVTVSSWIEDIQKRQSAREKQLTDSLNTAVSTGKGKEPEEVYSSSGSGTGMGTTNGAAAHGLNPNRIFDVSQNKQKAMNRIELSELLMNDYLYAKQDWELERDLLIQQASKVYSSFYSSLALKLTHDILQADLGTKESQKALNDLTRKLSHITAARQAQLAAKYSDAVVRGYSHTMREYMASVSCQRSFTSSNTHPTSQLHGYHESRGGFTECKGFHARRCILFSFRLWFVEQVSFYTGAAETNFRFRIGGKGCRPHSSSKI